MSDVKIRVKRTNDPGVLPGPLALGELAVNIPDRKIFIGNGLSNTLLYDGTSFSVELAEQVRDLLASTLVAGDNVNIDVDDTNDTITISLSPDSFANLLQTSLVAGQGIELDFNDTNDTVTISAPGSIWDRSDATVATDIFGIPAGTTFTPGTDAITILERILYPFQPATISSFSMSGSTTMELGQNVSSPSFTWSIGNLANANTATLSWSGLLTGSSVFNPASNQTNYNPSVATVNSTTVGASLSFTLTVTQDDAGYSNATSTRTITWRPKIYVGRSTQSDYTNITNVSGVTGGSNYFVSGTSPDSPSGGITVSSGSGYIYILIQSSINDLSTMSIEQTPGQLSAFNKVSSSHTIYNGYANSTYKVYRSVNELTGSVRLDFT
jgi:hypothetical protein